MSCKTERQNKVKLVSGRTVDALALGAEEGRDKRPSELQQSDRHPVDIRMGKPNKLMPRYPYPLSDMRSERRSEPKHLSSCKEEQQKRLP